MILNANLLNMPKILGPYQSGETSTITIDIPNLPNHKFSFLLFGNGNAVETFAIIIYEATNKSAQIKFLSPQSTSSEPVEVSGTQFTINNLKAWGFYYALVP